VALLRTDISDYHLFFQEPHGVTFQKTAFFIVTAVETKIFHLEFYFES
jgi:hypothetical protein